MKKLHITFDTYAQMSERLGRQILSSKRQYDVIVCLARGGMLVGDILSRMLDLPLAVMFASSYRKDGEKTGEVVFSEIATIDPSRLSGNVLLVDDLLDSGVTIEQAQKKLKNGYTPESIDIAVLWWKHTSEQYADYYIKYLNEEENCWIVQPFEEFELT